MTKPTDRRWAAAYTCPVCAEQITGGERCYVHNVTPERRDEAIRNQRCYACDAPLVNREDRYVGSCMDCVPIKLNQKFPLELRTPLEHRRFKP